MGRGLGGIWEGIGFSCEKRLWESGIPVIQSPCLGMGVFKRVTIPNLGPFRRRLLARFVRIGLAIAIVSMKDWTATLLALALGFISLQLCTK